MSASHEHAAADGKATTADDDGLTKAVSNAHSHHSHHPHHAGGNKHNAKEHANAAVIEYGYPNGHIGHLTADENKALLEFKAFLQEKKLYQPGPPPSHDDATILRFLRARRWIVQDAYGQFKDTEDWRAANQINILYDTIDLDAYEQSRRLYPQWTGRRDKRGIPLYLFEIRHLDSKTISNYEKTSNNTYSKAKPDGKTPPKLLRLFALYENLTRFAQPLCTEMPDREYARETPITLSTNIVDVSGVSLRQFWNLKSHMQAASTLATAHYPETLDRIFIIGAPVFFSTVWGWIKRWFDPVTVSKIFILSHSEVLPTLKSFIDVKNIPKQYGGELAFNWGEFPNLDPSIQDRVVWENGHTGFPIGPLLWRPIEGDLLECIAAGSTKQVDRLERVCTIPKSYVGVPAVVPEELAAAAVGVAAAEVTTAAAMAAANGHAAETKQGNGSAEPPVEALAGLSVAEKTGGTKETVAATTEKVA